MKVLLLATVLLVIGFFYKDEVTNYARRIATASFCDKPIEYRLGEIDKRFEVTDEAVLRNANSATQIWNSSFGKPLFSYNKGARLTINLVYDARQKAAKNIYISEKGLTFIQQSIEQSGETYAQKKAEVLKEIDKLNSEINSWNEKGGAPLAIYEKLTNKQKDLKDKIDKLNSLGDQLNQTAIDFNDKVGELNQKIESFNSILDVKPEEGLYSPSDNKIEMYIYSNQNEFIHTLAHEFGHALGLPHTLTSGSMMYPTTGSSLSLSAEDITILHDFCKERSVMEIVRNDLEQAVRNFFVSLEKN